MITLDSPRLFTSTIIVEERNLRTSQRAGKKYLSLKRILSHIDYSLGIRFDEMIRTSSLIEKNKFFSQNTILWIAFDILKRRFGYKKDGEDFDNLFHTILKRIDDEKDSELAEKYFSALQEKVAVSDGEKIKHRTKKNLFFSILEKNLCCPL